MEHVFWTVSNFVHDCHVWTRGQGHREHFKAVRPGRIRCVLWCSPQTERARHRIGECKNGVQMVTNFISPHIQDIIHNTQNEPTLDGLRKRKWNGVFWPKQIVFEEKKGALTRQNTWWEQCPLARRQSSVSETETGALALYVALRKQKQGRTCRMGARRWRRSWPC